MCLKILCQLHMRYELAIFSSYSFGRVYPDKEVCKESQAEVY